MENRILFDKLSASERRVQDLQQELSAAREQLTRRAATQQKQEQWQMAEEDVRAQALREADRFQQRVCEKQAQIELQRHDLTQLRKSRLSPPPPSVQSFRCR